MASLSRAGTCLAHVHRKLRPPIPEQGKLYAWYKQLEVAVLNEEAPDEDGNIVTAAVTQLPEHWIHAMYFAAPSAELCPHLRRTKFIRFYPLPSVCLNRWIRAQPRGTATGLGARQLHMRVDSRVLFYSSIFLCRSSSLYSVKSRGERII
jgi:hypothetical protein